MKRHHRLALALLTVAGVAAPAGVQGASQKYGELLKRVPQQANVLLLVDVDGLLNSPLGQREKWRDQAANRPTGVLGVSADASKFVVASGVDLQSLDERWKLGLLETHASPPQLTVLAGREGGYVEQLETQNVAWTPRGFYLFTFPERIVGFALPSDRQLLGEWIRSTLVRPRTFPAGWADRALFRADAGSQIVLAVNLENAIAPKQAEPWLKSVASVKQLKLDPQILALRLVGAQSAFLQIDVTQAIQGTIRVEFELPVDYIGPVAKDLILATLEGYGAHVEDLQTWTIDVQGKVVNLSGRLSKESVRRILSFVSVPRLSPTPETYGQAPATAPAEPAKEQSPRDVAVKISQPYFRAVTDIVETLKKQKATTYSSMKLWYERYAKQIEELPILGVDQDLLAWGSKVALTLREMASGINYSVKDRSYRLAEGATGSYDGYGTYYTSTTLNHDLVKARSDAVLSVDLDARWQAMQTSISEMRRQMVAKYQVDF